MVHCAAQAFGQPASNHLGRMLDCRAMNELRLRFCDGDQADLVIAGGVHPLGRLPTGLGPVGGDEPWLLRICNDRRGIWMTVDEGLQGVHVNGRPIQQVALLRAGDSIHVDGSELVLLGSKVDTTVPVRDCQKDSVADLRLSLRGVGGSYHGRSLSLGSPRRVGSAQGADICIEGHGIVAEHAMIEACNGQPVLRKAATDVLVNGHRVREAVLRNGDQVAFDIQHRFIVECPPAPAPGQLPVMHSRFADDADLPPPAMRNRWSQRIPWLMVAALLMASALFALFAYGAR